MFKISKQMRKERQDVVGARVVRDSSGQILVSEDHKGVRNRCPERVFSGASK